MGVTGISQATAQLLAMYAGFIPPTLNFSGARPGCALDYVPNVPRPKNLFGVPLRQFRLRREQRRGGGVPVGCAVPPRRAVEERVVVTGLGVVTSLGLGIEQTLGQLRRNATGLTPVSKFPWRGQQARCVGQVGAFKAAEVDRRIDFDA